MGYNERKKLDRQQTAKGPIKMAQPAMLAIMDAQYNVLSTPPDQDNTLQISGASGSQEQNVDRKEKQACFEILRHISQECNVHTKPTNSRPSYTQQSMKKYLKPKM